MSEFPGRNWQQRYRNWNKSWGSTGWIPNVSQHIV